jgi:DNA-binding PadR family transcriptional regulator
MSDDTSAANDTRITRAIVGSLRERDLSGYAIWQWLGPVHGAQGGLSEANLYPTLHRLEAAGLLESAWREGERTRRTYRITAAGLKEAESRGWGTLAHGRIRGEGAPRDSGEDETGWTWHSEVDPPAPADDAAIPDALDDGRGDIVEIGPIKAYLHEFEASLRLSAVYRHDARHEIGDHIADSATQRWTHGIEPREAVTEAMSALGPAHDLAVGINSAQLTAKRLHHGMQWASAEATLAAFGALALAWLLLVVLTPTILWTLTHIGAALGLHLYAPFVGELHTEDLGIAGCIGAFVGARRSMPALALKSRQAEAVVWKKWALLGAPPLALLALVVPANLDPLSTATLIAIPLAWVTGTKWSALPAGDVLTTRGVTLTAAMAVTLLVLPGVRVWGFQPAQEPAAASPYMAVQNATVAWTGEPAGARWRVTITLPSESGWHDARLEVWRARREGVMIAPDPAGGQPTLVANGGFVDFAALSGSLADWWVTVSAIGPDGQRHTIASDLRLGHAPHFHGSVLQWLLHSL